ncbi:1-deoxy-D-xylulose-5-phosphate reductoisomerase [Helicobacter suis]|uniref:1-deoxy-D-xylulose-5-phosphate reductoisomerase n=1 Tax=Helicobacter suis TaxID=104628 RepID=UPI0013D58529|nr:1-deoxy-D-xylulose-5-phosphate reductoisomerase [Helicobacter suis]
MNSLLLLGSTGSIGRQSLEVARAFNLPIEGLSAGKNIELLNAQIKTYHPQKVALLDPQDLSLLKVPAGVEVFVGIEGLNELVGSASSSIVLNALVGFAGLEPSLIALKQGKTLALANKESLVVAGWLLNTTKILPIDSEHFALWDLLQNTPKERVESLYITASGGALRDVPIDQISSQSLEKVLKHPNWQMGPHITINSANMVNKLFEVLEAYYLFGIEKIEACIERSSCVHALLRFKDQSWHAQLASPDMQLPIAYALCPNLAYKTPHKPLEILQIPPLTFEPIQTARYPLWGLKDLLLENPKLGVVLNTSNEIALKAFMDKQIRFGKIATWINQSLYHFKDVCSYLHTLEDVKNLDQEVRSWMQKEFL